LVSNIDKIKKNNKIKWIYLVLAIIPFFIYPLPIVKMNPIWEGSRYESYFEAFIIAATFFLIAVCLVFLYKNKISLIFGLAGILSILIPFLWFLLVVCISSASYYYPSIQIGFYIKSIYLIIMILMNLLLIHFRDIRKCKICKKPYLKKQLNRCKECGKKFCKNCFDEEKDLCNNCKDDFEWKLKLELEKQKRMRSQQSTPAISGFSVPKIQLKNENLLLFISYATKDAEGFRIHKIAEQLTSYDRIGDVLYWQEDAGASIIEYMEENLKKTDILLLFCSPNALASSAVKKEYEAAQFMGKIIIPIFSEISHVPTLLQPERGVKFNMFNLQSTINDIYELILKKIQ